MAVNEDASPIPNFLTYTPGLKQWIQPICVEAGDRLYLAAPMVLQDPQGLGGADVVPDGTAAQGIGYMPHWAYRPIWMRQQDVNAPPAPGTKLADGLNGIASVGSTIRVDLGELYCPWAGTVTIEGGQGPLIAGVRTNAFPLTVAYGWDQKSRQHQRWWWPTSVETINRLLGLPAPPAHGRLPRVPTDARLLIRHTLTFWNCPDGTPIQRPAFATSVWTPDQQGLILDNGVGTTFTVVRVFGEANRAPLGAYNRIVTVGGTNHCIICGIDL